MRDASQDVRHVKVCKVSWKWAKKVCFELLCSQIMDNIEDDDYDNLLESRYLFTKQVSRRHVTHLK